jgi:SAM-dependent methyltransferase
VLRANGYTIPQDSEQKLLDPATIYAEGLFSILGAEEIVAIDASDFEGAQIVHDMNKPIDGRFLASFDVVFDGGTLEHVFNFPQAIANCMQMVRPGGCFIAISPTNNFSGHGFYQFSPELFYRLLSPPNGYCVNSLVVWEDVPGSQFYDVPDPDTVRARIEVTTRSRAYIFAQAERTLDCRVLGVPPQQSDYVRRWNAGGSKKTVASRMERQRQWIKSHSMGKPLVSLVRALREWLRPYQMARAYRNRRLDRNVGGLLKPLAGMRVKLTS